MAIDRIPLAFGKSTGGSAIEIQELPVADQIGSQWLAMPAGYIEGLLLEWVIASSIRITSGACTVPGIGTLTYATAITKTGIALGNSVWGHVYAYSNAGSPDFEVSTTAPAAPYSGSARTKTGDTTRRYIGSFKTDASGAIIKFLHNGAQVSYVGNVSNNLVLNANATTAINIDLSLYSPLTASNVQILFLNNSSTILYIGYANGPVPGSNSWVAFIPAGGAQKLDAPYPMAGDSLQGKYEVSSPNGSLGWVAGYAYGR